MARSQADMSGWRHTGSSKSRDLELKGIHCHHGRRDPLIRTTVSSFGGISFVLFVILSLFTIACNGSEFHSTAERSVSQRQALQTRDTSNSPPLLRNFQVSPPVYSPEQNKCQQTLMEHSFGQSYGKPYIGQYSPPSCKFNKIALNFTVISAGVQFDRLAFMYMNDTELFRTSTAEPTLNGIIWTYVKDVSELAPIFTESGKLIFALDNNVDGTYNGTYTTTLTATYFTEEDVPAPADLILPVSARLSSRNATSAFRVPIDEAVNILTLPRNIKKAIFTIAACGQADEEFWWSNVPTSATGTFNNATLFGFSAFRETQLLIDNKLAGISWPFPVIFTGGLNPGFWRPISGIDAFDLKEDEIDISPWIPLLADDKEHSFEMRVVGINDTGSGQSTIVNTVGNNWVVAGKIFLWLDGNGTVTSGEMKTMGKSEAEINVQVQATPGSNGTNTALQYSVLAQRNILITAKIKDSAGERDVSWRQSLSFSNTANITQLGNSQTTTQMTSGVESSSSGYSRQFRYPLQVDNTFTDDSATGGNMTLNGSFDRSRNEEVSGRGALGTPVDGLTPDSKSNKMPAFAAYVVQNRQHGSSRIDQNLRLNLTTSKGRTQQVYLLSGLGTSESTQNSIQKVLDGGSGGTELFRRDVTAVNAKIVRDTTTTGAAEGFIGNNQATNSIPDAISDSVDMGSYAFANIRDMMGRRTKKMPRRKR